MQTRTHCRSITLAHHIPCRSSLRCHALLLLRADGCPRRYAACQCPLDHSALTSSDTSLACLSGLPGHDDQCWWRGRSIAAYPSAGTLTVAGSDSKSMHCGCDATARKSQGEPRYLVRSFTYMRIYRRNMMGCGPASIHHLLKLDPDFSCTMYCEHLEGYLCS